MLYYIASYFLVIMFWYIVLYYIIVFSYKIHRIESCWVAQVFKLFVRGDKQNPISFKGERTLRGTWIPHECDRRCRFHVREYGFP